MLKRSWLLVVALAACTNAHGPKTGTQTGNPPVLDRGRITLEVSANDVHIVGEPGAATPGGANIEITNLTTGEVIAGVAAADGSFDIRVDGSLEDTFSVRAVANGESSAPVHVVRGGAAIGEEDDSPSCKRYPELGRASIHESVAAADRSCTSADDCAVITPWASCAPICFPAYVSRAGAEQIDAAAGALEQGLCASANADNCWFWPLSCMEYPPADCVAGQCVPRGTGDMEKEPHPFSCEPHATAARSTLDERAAAADRSCSTAEDCVAAVPSANCSPSCAVTYVSIAGAKQIDVEARVLDAGLCALAISEGCSYPLYDCNQPAPAACVAGQCTGPAIDDGELSGCTTCFTETLEWGMNGGLVAFNEQSELAPCGRYTHRRVSALATDFEPASCERDLIACNASASVGGVMNALSRPEVQRAFGESPVLYGTDPRSLDGSMFRMALDGRVVEVGGSCEGAPPNCIPAPVGITELVALLQSVDDAMLATEECADFPR